MIRSPRRRAGRSRVALVALVAAGGVALAGCGAGQQAQTAEQRPTVDGTNAQAGDMALRNIAIEYPDGGRYEQGSDARLRMVLVNEGMQPDALVEVRTDAAERVVFRAAGEAGTVEGTASPTPEPTPTPTATATPTATPGGTPTGPATASPGSATPTESPTPSEAPTTRMEIPAEGRVAFGDDGPAVILTGLTRPLRSAEVVPITFVFERAGSVTVDVAVGVPEEEIAPAPTVERGGEE